MAAGDAGMDRRIPYRRVMPWLVAVGLFMEQLDATVLNTAIPAISADLEAPALSLKSVLTTYTLSLAVFIPISGWIADRYGTRRVFRFAMAVFTLGSLLCAVSVNIGMLIASRLLQGIGGALMTPVGRLALVRTFPRSEMLTAMNFVVIPALVAPLVGPFIGGAIVHVLPWRFIFLVNIPIGIAGWWMSRRFMPDYADPFTPALDRVGFLLFGAGVALLSYVLEVFGEHSWEWGGIGLMTLTSVMLLVGYGWHARRAGSPILHMRMFRIRTFRVPVVGGFVTRLGVGGMPFLLPLLYQIGLGYTPLQAGLLTMPLAAAAIGMKVLGRRMLERFGHRAVLNTNTVLLGANIGVFFWVGATTPVWVILALSFTQGLFSSLQFTALNSLVYADVDDQEASKASSVASTAQQMALSFGVAVASLVAGLFLRDVQQTDAAGYITGLHWTFLSLGIFTLLSSLLFRELHPADGANVSHHVLRREAVE
ncbi:MAG TPA: DHA2 family efflux MFS transporter permease subunit [Flavobacteriales bacterium]